MGRSGEKSMERDRGTVLIIVITLIISIIGLGIAFSAFSQQLTISGSATVEASSWNIYFTDTNKGNDPGTSTGVSITPTLSNTQSGIATTATGTGTLKTANFTWSGTFKTPGDRISYSFYIYNNGDYSAKLTSINAPTVNCTKGGSTETTVCGYITYGLYTDSTGETALAQNSVLAPDACQKVYVIATLGENLPASSLPNASITVNPTTISLTYTQI